MFPTFTGNSRRPRNVNLSGQKNINPFGASTGTPKPVADAAAERRQRQQERERKQAAQKIQRLWRGHRARCTIHSAYRARFDGLYSTDPMQDVDGGMPGRLPEALTLLLFVFNARSPSDLRRLTQLSEDFDKIQEPMLLTPSLYTPVKMRRLAVALMRALDVDVKAQQLCDHSGLYLKVLCKINRRYPHVLDSELWRYYTVLGRLLRRLGPGTPSGPLPRDISLALVQPLGLQEPLAAAAYHEFAVSFLSQPSNHHFDKEIRTISQGINMARLSKAVIDYYSTGKKGDGSQDKQMWLLAHFIALLRATSTQASEGQESKESLRATNLKALYMQLSTLSSWIRMVSSARNLQDSIDNSNWDGLPQYVEDQVASLVTQEGIAHLLEGFTLHHSAHNEAGSEDAGIFAAYLLTLIHSFPSQSDDIRMRLYMADIQTPNGPLPALRFLWEAMFHTTVFEEVTGHGDNTLDVIRRTQTESGSFKGSKLNSDREWRSILIFLELYSFVLRVTDDDDFFSALSNQIPHSTSSSRIRQNGLMLEQLEPLTRFLKHLGFTLIYDAARVLSNSSAERFSIMPGVDYVAFKGLVTTTLRMLYERDSRRPFLPKRHWLMTSKFDMEEFLSAVVLEEQRQHEVREQEDVDDDAQHSGEDDDMDDDEYRVLSSAGLRRSRLARIELLRRQQKKATRDRTLAQLGPKLEILRNMPFVIPFETRVKIFRQLVTLDKTRRRNGYLDPDQWRAWVMEQRNEMVLDPHHAMSRALARHHAKVQRGYVFQTAMEQFYPLGDGLKEPIQITFVDQFGTEEAGIDGGGVTKEFLMSVTNEAFNDQHSLFVANNKNAFYPNPCALDQTIGLLRKAGCTEESPEWKETVSELMKQYEFLGRIIGKCLYEGILIDIVFAGFFLLKWASSASDAAYRANINDLHEMDDELYNGMLKLKTYGGDVSELGIDFTLNDQVSSPEEGAVRTVTRSLVPNGEDTLVTNENLPLYISYVARHRLVVQPYAQTRAFLRGLGSIIDPKWLTMFNQNELQRLVGGDSAEIDVKDLRAHSSYSGVYQIGNDGEEHPTVKLFWEVMYGLEDHERRDVLKYVTSTPRAPLLGFSQLRPPFTIRDGGQYQERLPSASTCVNLLKLPQYTTAAKLKEKLLYAVTSGAGFDLS